MDWEKYLKMTQLTGTSFPNYTNSSYNSITNNNNKNNNKQLNQKNHAALNRHFPKKTHKWPRDT